MDTLPLAATDNGDGTSTLKVDTELTATIDPTGLATSAKQDTGNSSLSSINAKLPTLVGGKIPVDASVSIDAIDIGNVDITEFPAGNLGQQLKAASLSVAPATDITDATYLGDIKFGESLPAGSAIVGKVGIDQTTPGTTNLVNVNGGASQTSDIKVTLDSEKVAVSAIDAGTNLIGKVGIDQVTANANEVVVKSITAGPLPDTSGSNLAALGANTDAAASASVDEDATSRSMIALLKGQKNLLIDVQASLAALDTLMRTTGITYLPISSTLDSIDVAKMTKGAVTTAHDAITATATSAEIDCRGFNSLLVHWVSSATDKTWVISVTGAMGSGLTFVPLLDKTTGLAASEITTDISGFFVISNIPDYVKIVATEVDDGATVTCKVQPFNG